MGIAFKKIFGLLKVLIGIIIIIVGIGALLIVLKQDKESSYVWIGTFLAFICFEYYGFYLIYGGFNNFKNKIIKYKFIIWIAFIIGFLFVLTYLSLLITDESVNLDISIILLISFFFIPIIFDLIDIINIKKQNNNAKQ